MLTDLGNKWIIQTFGLGRERLMIDSVSSEVGAGTACPLGVYWFRRDRGRSGKRAVSPGHVKTGKLKIN